MKRILMSLASIGAVAAVAVVGTGAFFSDTETSEGNSFQAGAVDLLIDSTAHYAGMICIDGEWVDEDLDLDNNPRPELIGEACDGSWDSTDLTEERFFNFFDIKPGDYGENTISMTVVDNDAWACMYIANAQDEDNSLTEPEAEVDPDGLTSGELAENLYFTSWLDQGEVLGWQCIEPGNAGCDEDPGEGDNIWQGSESEPLLFTNQSGPASDVLNGKVYTLADSASIGGPLAGGVTNYIGLQWCAGQMTINDPGIECDGSSMGNETQTDSFTADVGFYVEQSRNNDEFVCPGLEEIFPSPTPTLEPTPTPTATPEVSPIPIPTPTP